MQKRILGGLVGVIAGASLLLTGCPQQYNGFPQPDGTVPVNFSIDASARPAGHYSDGDLEWKGSFIYDSTTRMLTYDGNWTGPYVPLHDDGPWTEGGHEPEGETAGDDIFGATVFVTIPTEDLVFEYGAQTSDGGWIWTGANGSVTVTAAGATATADGMSLAAFGNVDLRFTLDTAGLAAGYTTAAPYGVKGTFNSWGVFEMWDDGTDGDATSGDGVYTYVLSVENGPALVTSGSYHEFCFTYGDPVAEYKATDCETQGVTAEAKIGTGNWAMLDISAAGNGNPQILAP